MLDDYALQALNDFKEEKDEEIASLRALFRKYIDHVGNCEGVDFLHDIHRPKEGQLQSEPVSFTDEEWAELRKISGAYPPGCS